MDRYDFLRIYRHLIDVYFNDANFLSLKGVMLLEREVSFSEANQFFIPRFEKNGRWDNRGIEISENDPKTRLIALEEARQNVQKWDLKPDGRVIPPFEEIWPIPVATSTKSKKSVILDSNHLLANTPDTSRAFTIIEILSAEIELIVRDFRILNRQE